MYTFNSREELAAFIVSEVINTSEAREILGCSRQNIDDLIKRGKLIPIRILAKDKWFFKSDVLSRKKN